MNSGRSAHERPGGTAALRAANAGAAILVVALSCAAYAAVPAHRGQLNGRYGWPGLTFSGVEFLVAAASAYSLALLALHLLEPAPEASKSLRSIHAMVALLSSTRGLRRRGLAREDRVAVLATLLKAFYGPLMAMSLMVFCTGAVAHATAIATGGDADTGFKALSGRHGYWFLMQLFLFVDVAVFTVGYLVELPRLGNRIRSVDPTLLGWAAALACYPPFNYITGAVLGSQVSDLPRFEDPTVHMALNFALLVLMAGYAWTSLAMGFKASNLTHRGIVSRGPYRVLRHPAYVFKNMAWWIASVPLVSLAFDHSWFDGLQAFASVVAWTMLYVLRALTEEDHLRSVDDEYAVYADKVRYRFIPGVY